ncbi:MAG: zinc ribbon domain-containing protein [Chloroflexota bacterium]|nr:zinc ribbon domain-containing protein [Dehalococcoidia bacterium]MDW8253081.1 zinc ribbon domain-containing protein [Chloroflexota bacterium]
MPIYEFRCLRCRRRVEIFTRSVSQPYTAVCEHCGSTDLRRIMPRVAVHRTEADRLAELDTSKMPGEDFYRDSRNIGLYAKKRMAELGMTDLMPQIDEIVEKGRSGELLKEYEAAAESREF